MKKEWADVKPTAQKMNPHLSFDDFDEEWKVDRTGVWECPFCGKVVNTRQGLAIHRGKMHPKVESKLRRMIDSFLGSRLS